MKLYELYSPARIEPESPVAGADIDYLLSVLMQDHDGNGIPDILDKIEKFMHMTNDMAPERDFNDRDFDIEPEIYPVIKESKNASARIESIKELLSATDDPVALDRVESLLREAALDSRVEKLFEARGFNKHKRMSIYKDSFADLIKLVPASVKSKLELLFYFTRNKPSIPASAFKGNYRANLNDIVPDKVKNNDAYKLMIQKMLFASAFKGKGIGPGEFGIAMLGESGMVEDANGDISVGGWGIELKDGKNGSLKPGNPSTPASADKAKANLLKKLGIEKTITPGRGDTFNKFALHYDNVFTQAMKELPLSQQQQLMNEWANELYVGLDSEVRKDLVINIVHDLGTPAAQQHYGPPIMSAYKEYDHWDSILFINEDLTIVNITDPAESKNYLQFTPKLARGGDKQALPDGYINAKIAKK